MFHFGGAGLSLLHEDFFYCGNLGCSLVATCGLFIVVYLFVAEHQLWGAWAPEHELSSCGAEV